MKKTTSPILLSALAAGLCAAASPTHATLVPGAAASGYYFSNTTETGYVFGGYNRGSTINVGETGYSHSNAVHDLSASAAMGEVHVFNEVTRTTNGTSKGQAAGGFQDMITISDPARTGHLGVFNGSLRIDMDQTYTGSYYNNLFGVTVWDSMQSARLAMFDTYPGYAKIAYNWFGGTPVSIHTDLAFSVGFTFGTPFDLGV